MLRTQKSVIYYLTNKAAFSHVEDPETELFIDDPLSFSFLLEEIILDIFYTLY